MAQGAIILELGTIMKKKGSTVNIKYQLHALTLPNQNLCAP
jgi:hypothetical protein